MQRFFTALSICLLLLLVACQPNSNTGTAKGPADKATTTEKIKAAEADLRGNTSGTFDVEKAKTALAAYEEYVSLNLKDPETSEYLFKSAEIYRSLNQFDKAVAAYERIGNEFPNYDKAPQALFLMAFCYENDLGQKDKAKTLYQSFLTKYPNHELKESVQFSLDNIDKSPEQIIKEFEAKQPKTDKK